MTLNRGKSCWFVMLLASSLCSTALLFLWAFKFPDVRIALVLGGEMRHYMVTAPIVISDLEAQGYKVDVFLFTRAHTRLKPYYGPLPLPAKMKGVKVPHNLTVTVEDLNRVFGSRLKDFRFLEDEPAEHELLKEKLELLSSLFERSNRSLLHPYLADVHDHFLKYGAGSKVGEMSQMFYFQWASLRLAQVWSQTKHQSYHFAIRARPDIFFDGPVEWERLIRPGKAVFFGSPMGACDIMSVGRLEALTTVHDILFWRYGTSLDSRDAVPESQTGSILGKYPKWIEWRRDLGCVFYHTGRQLRRYEVLEPRCFQYYNIDCRVLNLHCMHVN